MTTLDHPERRIVTLMGPTGSGKTALAIAIAERIPTTLISVDSAMVFRGLDIGTAKPPRSVLANYPHHLIDVCEPEDSFSVADFYHEANRRVEDALNCGKVALLVGGSHMYFKSFIRGLVDLPPADKSFRMQLHERRKQIGIQGVYDELQDVDPLAANQIHPHNYARIERALEVYALTKLPISKHWEQQSIQTAGNRFNASVYEFALTEFPRNELHERLRLRLSKMFEHGFVEEVRSLRKRSSLTSASQSMQTVGYKQLWDLAGTKHPSSREVEQAQDQVLIATRRTARRQLIWLRSWPDLSRDRQLSFDASPDEIIRTIHTRGGQRANT